MVEDVVSVVKVYIKKKKNVRGNKIKKLHVNLIASSSILKGKDIKIVYYNEC